MRTLGERIKDVRKNRLAMNQESFARLFGLDSKSVVSMWENNTRKPEIEIAARIAEMGKVSLDWLVKGEGSAKPQSRDNNRVREKYEGISYPEFIVEARVPAGMSEISDLTEWYQKDVLDYNPDEHRFLEIDHEFGYSMMPLVNPGDMVLISLTAPVKSGDMVAAKWDDSRGALKICMYYPNDPERVSLTSYNPTVPPFSFKKKEIYMFKVVLLKKQ